MGQPLYDLLGGDVMAEDELINQNVIIEEDGSNIEMEETVDVIDVSDSESLTVDSLDAFPALGETNEDLKHQLLNGRELPDQHPITAITGLREELDDIEALDVVYSDKRNQADYYLWEDENILQEHRVGYFVSACSDINKIKICTQDNDIFGVTVDGAGFVGAQDDVARDVKYGLVVTTGVVHVKCEQPVNIGDFVISNNYGYAKKNKNGYKVVGRHLIDGIEYAEITLSAPISRMCELTDEVENVSDRMDDAETNIAAAINVANAAYNKAAEVGSISEEALLKAIEALVKSNESMDRTGDMEAIIETANVMAAQARAISESASVAAEKIRSEAVSTANNALSKTLEAQGEVNELISEISPLSQWESADGTKSGIVGFVARANADSATLATLAEWTEDGGDNQSIAGTIAKVNEHDAVLQHITSHQGVNGPTIAQIEQKADDNGASITSLVASVDKYSVGEYSQAYGLTREQAKNILKPDYIYIPTKHQDKQSHSEVFVGEEEVNDFTPGNYYIWDGSDWEEHTGTVIFQSSPPANSNNTYTYWYLDSDSPMSGYEAYSLYMWEDSKWKKINVLAGNASNRAVSMIRQTTSEIAAEVINARGSYAGLNARLEADKESQVALVAKVVNEDGTINTASIVNAVNESGSSVAITADHIVLDGYTSNGSGTFSIDENGHMKATGGVIGSWSIQDGYLQGYTDDNNYITMWAPNAASNDNGNFINVKNNGSYPFRVKADGSLISTKGSIGGWTISDKDLYIGNSYSDAPMGMGTTSPNWAFWAGTYKDSNGSVTANFRVTSGGSLYAKVGQIGGWTMSTNGLFSGDSYDTAKVGMSANFTSGSHAVFWAGYTVGGSSAFRVSADGTLSATKATITGTIHASYGSFSRGVTIGGRSISNWITSSGYINEVLATKGTVGSWGINDSHLYSTQRFAASIGGIGGYAEVFLSPSVVTSKFYKTLTTATVQASAQEYWYNMVKAGQEYANKSSDVRIKNSIDEFNDEYEILFDSLIPKRYKYNDGTSNRYHTGFIAQEVVDAVSRAGLTTQDFAAVCLEGIDEENGYWWLRRDEFVALNTWQIQKAKTRITELESRVEQLEKLLKEKGED